MNGRITNDHSKSWLRKYVWLLIISWTVVISASVTWNLLNQNQSTREIALSEARAYFNKDQAFRLWATSHGGLYVPSDERTPPSPYLTHIPDRDIETPSGIQLTLMNPAYAIRQMNEDFTQLYGVAGHITSLKPLRPENGPDDWERTALMAFNDGEKEVTEFTEVGGEPHLRLMGPLPTEEECLTCHTKEGYQVGDVIGGVGVSVPMTPLLSVKHQQAAVAVLGHGGLWLLGLLGIGLGTRQVSQRIRVEQRAYQLESENKRMEDELNIGRQIQMSMIPLTFPRFPEHKDIDVWAYLRPAREVGGDFYDFFFIDERLFGFIVADVSGKGVPAALLMAVVKTLLKANAQDMTSTARIIERTNNELSQDNPDCMFITAFFGIIDTKTGVMTYTNAGHNPPYLMSPDGSVNSLTEIHGPMIGVMEGTTYDQTELALGVDDKLVLYTDGVTEAFNPDGELFGEERLSGFLTRSEKLGTKYLVDALVRDIDGFAGDEEQSDDITVFCLRHVAWDVRDDRAKIELHLVNEMSEIDRCLQALNEFCERFDLPPGIRNDFGVVLDDLLNNIISYAFDDEEEHLIEVSLATDKQRFIITLSDDGVEFDPFPREEPDVESGIKDRQIGGLGIHLARSLMDDFSYRRIKGRNVTILMKRMGE